MSTQEKVRRGTSPPDSFAVKWIVVLATVIGGLARRHTPRTGASRWWHDRTTNTAIETPSHCGWWCTIEQGSWRPMPSYGDSSMPPAVGG
jgi:hypothetical protein